MIDLNSKKIILTLIEKSCDQEYLLNLLNITKRQLHYSILKINAYLSSNEQSVVVQNALYYSLPDWTVITKHSSFCLVITRLFLIAYCIGFSC